MEDSIELIMTEFEGMRWCSEHELKRVCKSLVDMINNLKAENARYRDALEFYARKGTWQKTLHKEVARQITAVDCDAVEGHAAYCGGRRARRTLRGEE